jgi:hypothetical protein
MNFRNKIIFYGQWLNPRPNRKLKEHPLSVVRLCLFNILAATLNIWRNAYRIFGGKPEGKRPLGRPRSRWVDNIKIHLRKIKWGWYGFDRSGSG